MCDETSEILQDDEIMGCICQSEIDFKQGKTYSKDELFRKLGWDKMPEIVSPKDRLKEIDKYLDVIRNATEEVLPGATDIDTHTARETLIRTWSMQEGRYYGYLKALQDMSRIKPLVDTLMAYYAGEIDEETAVGEIGGNDDESIRECKRFIKSYLGALEDKGLIRGGGE